MTEREHYISIAPDESDHAAACACSLERDEQGIVHMYQCAIHEAAPGVLAAIKELVNCAKSLNLSGVGIGHQRWDVSRFDHSVHAALAAIAKARP